MALNRLNHLLADKEGEKLLSIFVTAGYPRLDSTSELVLTLEQAGADFIEIGVPFSDPIADGPTIQRSSQIALANGVNLGIVLDHVRLIRNHSQIPLVLMSYLNPLLSHGIARLTKDAREAGVDGFIIPDLLPEDYHRFGDAFSDSSIGPNFLVSPNTSPARVKAIDSITRDFLYCVSVTGITGVRSGVEPSFINFLQSVKGMAKHRVFVGFGISNSDDAEKIARHCDGVVVGSALIDILQDHRLENKGLDAIAKFVHELKSALKGV